MTARGVVISVDDAADVLLKDITIDGYNHNVAISVRGTRTVLVNPTIVNPYVPAAETAPDDDMADEAPDETDGGGIRVTGGTGFRCYGGSVDGGGDAALQFSSAPQGAAGIADGAYYDTVCTAIEGRLMLVGSHYYGISHVRFARVGGTITGGGECLRVQNLSRRGGRPASPIHGVYVRDAAVDHGGNATPDYSVAVRNELSGAAGVVYDIRFDNLGVSTPRQSGLIVFAGPTASSPTDLSWIGGGVASPLADAAEPALDLRALDHAVFQGLRLAAPPGASAVAIGADRACRGVVLADAAITGVAAGLFGVDFLAAIHCAWVRGAAAGAAGAGAARLGTDADGCSVTGADLSAIGGAATAKVTVATAHPFRLARNRGSAQRTPLGLGPAAQVDFGGTSAAVASSAVGLRSTAGGGPATLSQVTGAAEGDLLVLGRSGTGPTIQATDASAGNLRLRPGDPTPGVFALATPRDTLTLVRGPVNWLELSQAANA